MAVDGPRGDQTTREDHAAREAKALRELTDRLTAAYTGRHSTQRITLAVDSAHRRFDGHTIRDFVPILVERTVRRELDGSDSTESPAFVQSSAEYPIESQIESRWRTAAKQLVTPPWTARKLALPLGALAVIAAVIAVLAGTGGSSPATGTAAAPAPVTVRGVVGSEKAAFFGDPKVVEVLAHNGLRVEVDAAGSREIGTTVDLSGYDFAFPSSRPAAERILRAHNLTTRYTPFSSPMAIATFRPIADLLTRAGLVRPGPVTTVDMHRYLELTQRGTQWNQLPGNTEYPVDKSLLIATTDPRTSNSAAMYLAVASYVANDDAIVRGATAEDFAVSKVARLFTEQGYTGNSSEAPFTEYLSAGMGPTPMVWIYEAQYVEAAVAGRLKSDAVLMYPSPTVYSQHTVVPLNAAGDRIGRLLSTDPQLQQLAAEHGFRTRDPAQFATVTAAHRVPVAADPIDVVDAPAYDTLEHLLDGVAKSYK